MTSPPRRTARAGSSARRPTRSTAPATAARRDATWLHVRLDVPARCAEAVGSLLVELGAPGALTGQRDLRRTRPGAVPRRATVEAWFPSGTERKTLAPALRAGLAALAASEPALGQVAPKLDDFVEEQDPLAWRGHFPPLRVGRRLLIAPSWTEIEPGRRHVLRIDPGLAFGTGHHSTTRGCLLEIERLAATAPFRSVLDVGCGTGVLAIAASALGAKRVAALDNDPIAQETTREALTGHGVTDAYVGGDLHGLRTRFDLVVANLFFDVLLELAPALAARTAPQGHLVVSGLLLRQGPAVRAALEKAGLVLCHERRPNGWLVLTFARSRTSVTPPARSTARTAPRSRRSESRPR